METNEPLSLPEGQDSAHLTGVEPSPAQKPRRFWQRTRKVAVILLLVILILGFAGGLFIQLPIFKRLVINELVSAVESSTNGTLTIGKIEGNLLEGFVMDDVTLRLKTGTKYDSIPLVHVDKVLASYSLWRWLRKNEIGVTSMVLEHPVIRFVKFAGDTTWNYSLLTKPVPTAPKAPPKPFTQIVDLAQLELQNGSFYARDYNFAPKQESTLKAKSANASEPAIDWSDVEAEEIDLESRFYARGDAMQSARIHHLSFIEKKSGFYVSHLECSAYLDSLEAKIEGAKITTGRSAIGFSVDLTRPKDSLSLSTLRHSNVDVSLKGPVIGTAELKQFLPMPLGFLGGSPGIDLEANGEFGKLKINELALDFKTRGTIAIAGELDNLHHPDSLAMNIALQGRNLSNATLDEYVPGLHLPNLSRFGNINISSLTYTGSPLNFRTKFDAKSSGAGDVGGDVALDLRHDRMQYRADVTAKAFNVAALMPGDDYESSITAEAQLAGHGTNWKTMSTTILAKTDGPSFLGQYRVHSFDLTGAVDHGTFTTEHLNAIIDGGPSIHVTNAMLGLSSESLPFRFDGTVDSLKLAQIIPSQSLNPARIDVNASIAGTAKNFENVTGTATVRLYNLQYQGESLPDDSATLSIADSSSNDNVLSFQSDLADVTIQRNFRTGDLLHSVPSHIDALLAAIAHRNFSTSMVASTPAVCADSMDFDYHVHIKDLRPLADFLPQTFLLAQGTIYGTVQGCRTGNLSLTSNGDSVAFVLRDRTTFDSTLIVPADTAIISMDSAAMLAESASRIDSLHPRPYKLYAHRKDSLALTLPKFGSGTPRIQAMPTSFRLALRNLSSDSATMLNRLDASLQFTTDSVLRLGSALLYRPNVRMSYRNQSLNFDIASLYNNAIAIHLQGGAEFPNGNLNATLDSLDLTYANPYFMPGNSELRNYIWRNSSPAHLAVTKSGIVTLDTLNVVHPLMQSVNANAVKMQRMSFGGTIQGDSVRAWASVPSFNLEDLKRILPFNPNAKTFDFASYRGRVRGLDVSLNGTLEQPEIAARLFVDSMTYGGELGNENKITFDSNAVSLSYRNGVLQGMADIHVDSVETSAPNGLNPTTVNGSELVAKITSIPVLIAFKRGPDYAADSARAATTPVSASIHATAFPLDVVTPFLPPFKQILGTGDIDFTIAGTRDNVQYAGQAAIHNGALLLASTNMWYLFGGPMTFAHNELVLQDDSVKNIPSDDPNGAASLNGNFNFKGFDITNFDLTLQTDRLMVLSNAAKESLPVAYGPVVISTGGPGFHFYNTFAAPWIGGTINVLSANVTMPQSSGNEQSTTGTGIVYETLPRVAPLSLKVDSLHTHPPIQFAQGAGSPLPNAVEDTLFPNAMKDIFRNDDGSVDTVQTTAAAATSSNLIGPSFTDVLRMNLTVNTRGNALITIPFVGSTFGLNSELKADLKSGGTLTIDRDNDLQTHANGGFELSPNSSFTFLKTFSITDGTVKFTNDFGNPTIAIDAEYIGTHQPPTGATDNVKIELEVTGTKNNPNLAIYNYEQPNGGEFEIRPEPNPEEAKEDAIYYLTTNNFKSELANNSAALASVLPKVGEQLGANLLSNLWGSTSSQFAIRSASLNLGSSGGQITGAYRDITIKAGAGYIQNANGVSSTNEAYGVNIETDVPLSFIISDPWAKDIQAQLQYNYINATLITEQPVFETKLVWTGLAKLLHLWSY